MLQRRCTTARNCASSSSAARSACATCRSRRTSSSRSSRDRPSCRRSAHPAGARGLEQSLPDIYYGNFSVFQSLPDVWAIEQVFPVMPVHRHNEPPTRQAIIADITCDSDGKIDHFIDTRGIRKTLPVHPLDRRPALLLRRVPGRGLPGDPRRPAQPDGRHQRGERAHQRRRHVRLRAGDERRQHRRRAELRRVPAAELLEQFRKTAEQGVRKGASPWPSGRR